MSPVRGKNNEHKIQQVNVGADAQDRPDDRQGGLRVGILRGLA